MDDSDETAVTICSATECKSFILNTSLNIEFDGCGDMSLSIMPIGRNPKQNMGFGGFETPHFNLTKLWLEIPLKPEIAKYYHIHPNAPLTVNGEQKEENVFSQADMLPQELAIPFVNRFI
jgi:hypothetical protein